MRIEDIEIQVGIPAFKYQPIRRLEAKCEATMAISPAPTVDEMNGKLRTMAAKVGANAIIEVVYKSGASMTSWKSMKGTRLAVRKVSDEIACPVCAETIKRAATKCRFCSTELTSKLDAADANAAADRSPEGDSPKAAPAELEPLRETNNPQLGLILGAILFFILIVAGSAGS